jgi:hypothetical protein
MISVPYADLIFAGLVIINHEFIDLDSSSDAALIALTQSYGTDVVEYHSTTGGKCETDITCPAVIRTSFDCSSFSTVFPTRI